MCPTRGGTGKSSIIVSAVEELHDPSKPSYVTLIATGVTCTVRGGSGQRTLFENLKMTLRSGELLDLQGASGSGKSSLLTALAQLNPRATATLVFQGRSSTTYTMQQWRQRVAYVPQKATLVGINVAEAIRQPWTLRIRRDGGAILPGDDRIRKALDTLGCSDIELSRPVAELSGGQATRIALLRTLLTNPDVLLADEVDASLDDDNATLVSHVLLSAAQRGMAVCRIRHRVPDGLASRTVTLKNGKLC